MRITPELAYGLDLALEGAVLTGIAYLPEDTLAGVSFLLPADTTQCEDMESRSRRFVLHRVGRIAVACREADGGSGAPRPLSSGDLAALVPAFGYRPIHGWEFFNVHDEAISAWGHRLSLDLTPPDGSLENSMTLSLAGSGDSRSSLDVCIWFESITIHGPGGREIPVAEFAAEGRTRQGLPADSGGSCREANTARDGPPVGAAVDEAQVCIDSFLSACPAYALASFLNERGVPARVADSVGVSYGLTLSTGGYDVLVGASRLNDAARLMSEPTLPTGSTSPSASEGGRVLPGPPSLSGDLLGASGSAVGGTVRDGAPPDRSAARRNMLRGGALCVAGIALTVGTYLLAARSPTGGVYVVAWGAILFGFLRFLRGLHQWRGRKE